MDISNLDMSELDMELVDEEIDKFVEKIVKEHPESLPYFLTGRMIGRIDVIKDMARIINAYIKNFELLGKLVGKK